MSDATISQLGRFKIVSELGRGAMGVVYRAEDPLLNRTVAIKTILMAPDMEGHAEYEARFYQEAKAAGGLNHPNIITIHDIGREGDTAYMAMELLDGVELREMMARGRVPLPLALELMAQVADGLAFAHERGVVHRDVKPANVMVLRGRHAKIMDFGIARMRVSEVKTQTGAVMGSPKYMSPEQVTGQRPDHRSDIFSLGLIVYEIASGAAPFSASTITGLMHAIATETPAPPSAVDASLPPVLDLIVARALEKECAARYQSAAEIAADLRACLERLAHAPAAAPAAAAAPVAPAGGAVEKTVKIAAVPAGGAGEKTVKIAAVPADAPTVKTPMATTLAAEPTRRPEAAGAGLVTTGHMHPLYPSRSFDSGAALQNLAAMAAGGVTDAGAQPASGAGNALRAVWGDPDRRVFAAAIVAAVIGAALIALL
jgi:serine/threonine-protein kinase